MLSECHVYCKLTYQYLVHHTEIILLSDYLEGGLFRQACMQEVIPHLIYSYVIGVSFHEVDGLPDLFEEDSRFSQPFQNLNTHY